MTKQLTVIEQETLSHLKAKCETLRAALPDNIGLKSFTFQCMAHIKTAQTNMKVTATKKTVETMKSCIFEAARDGLMPGIHCYFVPFKDQLSLIIGYKGIMSKANQAAGVSLFTPKVVFDGEEIVGPDSEIHEGQYRVRFMHKSTGDYERVDGKTLGNIAAAYCAFSVDGFTDVRYLKLSKLEYLAKTARKSSNQKINPFWDKFPVEMALKSAIIHAAKYLPVDQNFINQAQSGADMGVGALDSGDFTGAPVVDTPQQAEDTKPATRRPRGRPRAKTVEPEEEVPVEMAVRENPAPADPFAGKPEPEPEEEDDFNI